jgi:hypothetical protein
MSKSSQRQAEQPEHQIPFIVGDMVSKISGKPFKSQLKINTVKAIVTNNFTHKEGLAFVEDDSVVDSYQCQIVYVAP